MNRLVEILVLDGCADASTAYERARAAVAATGVAADIEIVRITRDDEVRRERFLGSPTERVDGIDVDPSAAERDDYGMQCRVYSIDGVLEGAPAIGWIVDGLRAEA
jgi:hypothetical protein